MRILLEPAFILHTKPYRETSLLIDFFTKNHGRVAAIARSARGNRSRFKGCLVPFSPLIVSLTGKTDLFQVVSVESERAAYILQGKNLFNGLYLNELLMKLLQRGDSCPYLFNFYQEAIYQLQNSGDPQVTLRTFEKYLLAELGYGLQLEQEASGKKVLPDGYYFYHLEQGVMPCNKDEHEGFRGSHLLAIEKNNYETKEILKDARKLMRLVLSRLLGHHTIKSRELFL